MLASILKRLHYCARTLRSIDTNDLNKFIFRKLKYHALNTRVIFTLLVSICIISFSILSSQSVYFFIPQTTVGSFASFLIFVLIVSILTFIFYPLIIIFTVNALNGLFKSNSWIKVTTKLTTLSVAFILGIDNMAQKTINLNDKAQIVIAWILVYWLILNRYLAHLKAHESKKYNKSAIIIIVLIAGFSFKPFININAHTLETLNITNINPQVYLTWPNCELLKNLNTSLNLSESNDTLNNSKYYTELKNNQGCFIYGNTIRYSFGYDYALLVKRNIHPLIDRNGINYNAYVRLNCFANNCYSDNNLQYKANVDIYNSLISNGENLDHTF